MKSAYRFLQMTKEEERGITVSDLWERMWKVRVPPKIKDFMWRASTNCLPTKTLLRFRHVNVDGICPLCQTQRVSVVHCLIDYTFARSCWNRIHGEINIDVVGSFASWLNDIMREGDDKRRN